MKKILTLIVIVFASTFITNAQNTYYGTETFSYNSNTVHHYGLGWYADADASAYGPMAYLSGFGGIKFFTGGAFKSVIDVNGNVGIGTATPKSQLHVGATTAALISIGTTDYGGGTGEALAGIKAGQLSGGLGGNLEFQTLHWSSTPYALTTKMIILGNNGYVGIGTTIPDQLLTVKGTIHSQEVKVDLSVPGPDYVFHPTYKLPTLTEVKAFINKNHHLSEIPSAAEMAKNGLDLGDMNMKLLKKVEELTLYLLEENKAKQEQQKEIDLLKQQLAALTKVISKTQ
jgi:hypothetical protein